MKRPTPTLLTALTLSALLGACGQTPDPAKTGPAPTQTTVSEWPEEITVPPYAQNIRVEGRSARILASPAWLKAAAFADGDGTLLKLSVPQPSRLIPTKADQPEVSGELRVSGETKEPRVITVTARLTQVSFTPDSAITPQALAPHATGRLLVKRVSGEVEVLSDTPQTRAALAADETVADYAPEHRVYAQAFTSNDPYSPAQWAMSRLNMDALRGVSYTRPVTVAVLDTGQMPHPDLMNRTVPGKDYITSADNGDGDGADFDTRDVLTPQRLESHGTHVAGIVAAETDNGIGVAGYALTAPVKVQPIRVLDKNKSGNIADVITALNELSAGKIEGLPAATRPDIINLSLGAPASMLGSLDIELLCEATSKAISAGTVVIAAAGNAGGTEASYPASCPGVLSVGAVTLDDKGQWVHAPYSQANSGVRLSAPGGSPSTRYNGGTLAGEPVQDGMFSTDYDGIVQEATYAYQSGTSMAAPVVSGVAALMLSSGMNAASVTERLISTSTDVDAPGRDDRTGAGVINPQAAVTGKTDPTNPAPTPAPTNPAPVIVTIWSKDAPTRLLRPGVSGSGAWTAYLTPGEYRALQGQDNNRNGRVDEQEITFRKDFTVGETPLTLTR